MFQLIWKKYICYLCLRYWPCCLSIDAEIPHNACYVFRKTKQEFIKLVWGNNHTNSQSRSSGVTVYMSGQVPVVFKHLDNKTPNSSNDASSAYSDGIIDVCGWVNDGRIKWGFRVMAIYNYWLLMWTTADHSGRSAASRIIRT